MPGNLGFSCLFNLFERPAPVDLAKDLLDASGSCFVQILATTIVHLVRNLMDEVFGVRTTSLSLVNPVPKEDHASRDDPCRTRCCPSIIAVHAKDYLLLAWTQSGESKGEISAAILDFQKRALGQRSRRPGNFITARFELPDGTRRRITDFTAEEMSGFDPAATAVAQRVSV